MVDFNQALALGEAVERCHTLDDMGFTWFEEPIAYNNLAGMRSLRASSIRRCSWARTSTGRAPCTTRCAPAPAIYFMPD